LVTMSRRAPTLGTGARKDGCVSAMERRLLPLQAGLVTGERAPIVPYEVDSVEAEPVEQREQVTREPVGRITVPGSAAPAKTAEVRTDDPAPVLGQSRK
jgi:hypothetical protein